MAWGTTRHREKASSNLTGGPCSIVTLYLSGRLRAVAYPALLSPALPCPTLNRPARFRPLLGPPLLAAPIAVAPARRFLGHDRTADTLTD